MTMAADPLFRGHWLVRCVSWVRGLGPGVRRWDGHHPFSVQLFAGTAGSAHGRSRGSPGRAQRLGWSQREPNLWPRTKAPGLVCPQKRDYLAALATLSGGLDDAGGEASLLAVARHMLVHKHWLSDAAPPPTRPSPRQQRTAWPESGTSNGTSTNSRIQRPVCARRRQPPGRPSSSPFRDAQLSRPVTRRAPGLSPPLRVRATASMLTSTRVGHELVRRAKNT